MAKSNKDEFSSVKFTLVEDGMGAKHGDVAVARSSKKSRHKRPNYNEIHAKPLPLVIHPLPAFIPHNPLSYLRIAASLFSYWFRLSTSHTVVHEGYFSPETQSIHVTNAASIRALWEQGFWGKGSLSRSEPQWLITEKRKRGAEAQKTSAEVTQSRREERRQFKLERAKAQREAIEQQLRDEGKLDGRGSLDGMVDGGEMEESPRGTIYTPVAGEMVALSGDAIASAISAKLGKKNVSCRANELADDIVPEGELTDLEHLQLTLQESFFLTYALGVLRVVHMQDLDSKASKALPAWFLMRLFCAHASSPVDEGHATLLQRTYRSYVASSEAALPTLDSLKIEPDNPFLLKYIAYHHFRSLGWVVRPGIKFAVDYLLYMRGPAFTHAEFAVMIIPSYSDPYWRAKPRITAKEHQDWWWLHRVHRVQTQVMKTLVLVYVEVPPHWDAQLEVDVGGVLKKYKVREFVVKRWSPARNRG